MGWQDISKFYPPTNIKTQNSRIDGASVTIILGLHVLIAHCILLILDILIIFSEHRCLKR
jgi:hypothetical protein